MRDTTDKFKVSCTKTRENIHIDNKAQWIMDILYKNGYTAFAVGGCVRDLLMNKYFDHDTKVNDTDLCTQATPAEMKALFKDKYNIQVLNTGIKHGTVSLVLSDSRISKIDAGVDNSWADPNDKNKVVYEVTTYRIESDYSDNRHPDKIEFSRNIEEDLIRRDFTINAMAYHRGTLVGVTGSFDDMKNGILRCVGDPMERFQEDPLRILRAFRFQAKLGFDIDKDTQDAVERLYTRLDSIQNERIHNEIIKAFSGKHIVKAVKQFQSVLTYVFKPMKKAVGLQQNNLNHIYDVYTHSVASLEAYQNYWGKSPDYRVALAIYLHDIGKPECISTDDKGISHFYSHASIGTDIVVRMLKELKFSNQEVQFIQTLVKYHDYIIQSKSQCRKLLAKIDDELFMQLQIVRQCDIDAQQQYNRTIKQANVVQTQIWYDEIKRDNSAVQLKDLKINGQDLMKLGLPAGKQIGIVLNEILQLVLDDKIENTKESLVEYAKGRIETISKK